MRLLFLLCVFLMAGCHPCNRDPEVWLPGVILLTFEESVTTGEATAIVVGLGYSYSEVGSGIGRASVPRGEECWAEDRLRAKPGVNSALQEWRISVR